MKVCIASDIHLEFGDCDIPNDDGATVLILSGDICVARDIGRPDPNNFMEGARSQRIRDFFRRCSERFPWTVYVMGNHEHYHGDFARTQSILQEMLYDEHLTNVRLLEKSVCEIDDYLFIGGTLWTDFNQGDRLTLLHAKDAMNDFRGVRNSHVHFYKFIPEHALEDHRLMKKYIESVIQNRRDRGEHSNQVIVVGHHSPSRLSTHPRYINETHMNGCYSSDMDGFILERPEICLWTHGHTHEDFDYQIGSTRVICNPRGYVGYEERTDRWRPKIVEL
jgi:hypothetical protein